MELFKKLETILSKKSLGVNDFLEQTGFSTNFYYSIKSGKKTVLTPKQADKINSIYPEFSKEWLLDNSNDTFDGLTSGIGIYLKDNHARLMEEDPTYSLFIDSVVYPKAIEIAKKLINENVNS